MASFTPLEVTEDLNAAIAQNASVVRRQAGARPVGIVIDRSCRVYITQIPVERIERDGANALRAELETFGPVESYKMFTEKSGRFIGSALCTYRNPADAAQAIAQMNGQTIDSSVLKVEVARDHGVMLLHQERRQESSGTAGGRGGRHGFLPAGLAEESSITSGADGGRWHHDRYALIAEGKDMDEVLGLRRGHRGGRGGRGGRYMSRGERIESAFEKYIAERDALIEKGNQEDGEEQVQQAGNEEGAPVTADVSEAQPAAPEAGEAPVNEGTPAEKTEGLQAPEPL